MFAKIIEKSAEKSPVPLPESASGSAFIFSKGERERVRHFEARANALTKSAKNDTHVGVKDRRILKASDGHFRDEACMGRLNKCPKFHIFVLIFIKRILLLGNLQFR